jgi:hypothetical protein
VTAEGVYSYASTTSCIRTVVLSSIFVIVALALNLLPFLIRSLGPLYADGSSLALKLSSTITTAKPGYIFSTAIVCILPCGFTVSGFDLIVAVVTYLSPTFFTSPSLSSLLRLFLTASGL